MAGPANELLRIDQLHLQNFRPFTSLTVNLHPELNVLTALNGGGKTTILDATAKVLSVFVAIMEEGPPHTLLRPQDVHRVQAPDRSSMEPEALIQQGVGDGEEGRLLRRTLEAHFGQGHPLLQDCDRLLRFQAFKMVLPAGGRP